MKVFIERKWEPVQHFDDWLSQQGVRVAQKHPQFTLFIFLKACDSETAAKPGLHEGKPFTHVQSEHGMDKGEGFSKRKACSALCLDFHLKACRPGRVETGIAAAHD